MNPEPTLDEYKRLLEKTADQLQKALVELARVKARKKPPSYARMFAKKHLNEKLTFKAD